MGKLVNIVTWDGRVVAVPEEDAQAISGAGNARPETDQEQGASALETQRASESSGIGNTIEAGVEGAADTLTGGIYGKVASAIAPEYGERMQNRAEHHGTARGIGGLAAILSPAGLFGDAAKAAGEVSAVGLASRAGAAVGESAGQIAGLATEGALFGAGAHVAETNVTGDPLTIEGFVESAGMGGMFNVGAGLVASKILGLTGIAKKGVADVADKAFSENALKETADLGDKLFTSDGNQAAYDAFADAHKAQQAAMEKTNRQILKEAESYTEATQPPAVASTIKDANKALREMQSEILSTAYGKEAMSARNAARAENGAYEKSVTTYERFTSSTTRYPRALQGFQKAIDEVAERYGGGSSDELMAQLQATQQGINNGSSLGQLSGQAAAGAGPSTMAEEIQGYRDQLSRASKLKSGGYDPEAGGRWNPSEADPKDVAGSMAELHDLRQKLSKFSHISVPDLPEIPVQPGAFSLPKPTGDASDVATLGKAAVDLDQSIARAREAARKGDGAGALRELAAVGERVRQVKPDLAFPEIPTTPRATVDFPKVDLPPNLRKFGAMMPETVSKLSNAVTNNPDAATALGRLAQTVGFDASTMAPGELVAGLQARMKSYISAQETLDRAAGLAKQDVSANAPKSWLRGMFKEMAASGTGFAAAGLAGGGFVGAAVGAGTRAIVRKALGGAEDSLLGTALAQGKSTVATKVRGLVAKYGTSVATGVKALGPVTANLSVTLNGEQDHEKDVRKQAVNRINEVLKAGQVANDTLYSLVKPMMGMPFDIAGKMHKFLAMALGYLVATAPKDPGMDSTLLDSQWTPSYAQVDAFARRMEAVFSPMKSLERTLAGDGHPAATEALNTVWPATMASAQEEIAMAGEQLRKLPLTRANGFSQVFAKPISSLSMPQVVLAIQGQYLPQPPTGQGQQGSSPTAGPNGRPPAVSSQVAGSNVSSLIS